ncbi:TPA: hypothetical protein HA251_00270 [Candidatus Woesearchaeota archaeon]|nr:hypothetical protein [Candidatus Woesearchaeota archaeon]
MPDAYLENPSLLRGTPKLTIGDYAERNGILVPRRFATLDDALASGKPFILRSEHPDEYAGPSGLFNSHIVNPEYIDQNRERLKNENIQPATHDVRTRRVGAGMSYTLPGEVIAQIGLKDDATIFAQLRFLSTAQSTDIQDYCSYEGKNPTTYGSQLTFSAWEYLGGRNHTVIADNCIPGRYHIFTTEKRDRPPYFDNYSMVDNGVVVRQELERADAPLEKALPSLIATYEHARALPNFDPNHCPAIEMQTSNGNVLFLQYHRVRDFEPSTHTIDPSKFPDAIETDFSRGATPPDGIVCDTSIVMSFSPGHENRYNSGEDLHYDNQFIEHAMRKREVQFLGDTHAVMRQSTDGHQTKSILFKPRVSLGISAKAFMTAEEWNEASTAPFFGKDYVVRFHAVSDGRRAFVRRIR